MGTRIGIYEKTEIWREMIDRSLFSALIYKVGKYKRHKRADILIMADKFKNKIPKKVYDVLLRY